MVKIKKPLLVLNEINANEEATIAEAFKLAKTFRTPLKIIKVIEKIPDLPSLLRATLPSKIDIANLFIKELEERLKTKLDALNHKKVSITVKVLMGRPFIEIISEVVRSKHDFLITAAEGRKGIQSIFSSTNLQLLRKCPCPVWVVRPPQKKKSYQILVAVDANPEEKETVKAKLNEALMKYAFLLARHSKSKIQLIHVWRLPAEETMRQSAFLGMNKAAVDKLVRERHRWHENWIKAFVKKNNPRKVSLKVHLLKGEAAEIIPKIAKKQGIDLIVMGTVCRIGIPGLIMGNTAENVLRQVTCSVLAIKPIEFETLIV